MKRKSIAVALLSGLILLALPGTCFAAEYAFYLNISFVGNWVFDTYDVDVFLDEEKIDTIPHGEDYTHLFESVEEGYHKVTFKSARNADISGEDIVEINGDTTFKCTLHAYSDEIKLDDVKTEDNVDGSAIPVPDEQGKILSIAEKELKEAGFTNIKSDAGHETIITSGNWTVTGQNLKAGETADQRAEIVLACKKTEAYIRDSINNLSAKEAISKTRKLGFSVNSIDAVLSKDMEERLRSMDDEEAAGWVVDRITPTTGKYKVEFVLLYAGRREVPDVVGLSYRDAKNTLRKLDFSNIDYETTNKSIVVNDRNWEVIDQNATPGASYTATENIHLILQSYDSKENDETGISEMETEEVSEAVTEVNQGTVPNVIKINIGRS